MFMACVIVGASSPKTRSRRCELTAAHRWLVYVSLSPAATFVQEVTYRSNGAQSTVISGGQLYVDSISVAEPTYQEIFHVWKIENRLF